jgi:Retroviral aspartyl protease
LYLNKLLAMQVPINYRSWKGGEQKERALVDSGATENFLDFHTVTRWHLGTQQLEMPRQVFDVDRTENQLGKVTKYCTLRITCGDMDQLQTFYVTNLGTDRVILGYPWLEAFNPQLDWKNGTLASPNFPIYLETQWYQTISRAARHHPSLRNPRAQEQVLKDLSK